MKRTALILTLTAALTACQQPGTTTPTGPVKISVTGPTVIATNSFPPLTVTVTNADGTPSTAPVTFTSSDPTTVDVDAQGRMKALRLSMAPVTVTATAAGQSAALTVTTYGLEIATGTDRAGDGTFQDFLYYRYRARTPLDGTAKLSITTPTRKLDLTDDITGGFMDGAINEPLSPDDTRKYTVMASVNGDLTYDGATSQPGARVGVPGTVSAQVSGRTLTVSGTLPGDVKAVRTALFDSTVIHHNAYGATLPNTSAVPASVPTGTYHVGVYTYNFPVRTDREPLPTTVARAYKYANTVNLH
ncbi:Ig-like domain-containing protein [Deinococcus sp. JMULE3]|uniref:Ig-like domain-containing protein n=1 Tax=Deinococcus sp. JMULE3 TaxID=2518341 RepID=UPI0015753DAE|nr:Ig-like domain-containing protein [Deinococcus sp. JMULE3]NTY02619.1 hypothetical protein [Deinococcus sp. JMULE3]